MSLEPGVNLGEFRGLGRGDLHQIGARPSCQLPRPRSLRVLWPQRPREVKARVAEAARRDLAGLEQRERALAMLLRGCEVLPHERELGEALQRVAEVGVLGADVGLDDLEGAGELFVGRVELTFVLQRAPNVVARARDLHVLGAQCLLANGERSTVKRERLI